MPPPYLDDGLADDIVDRCRSSSIEIRPSNPQAHLSLGTALLCVTLGCGRGQSRSLKARASVWSDESPSARAAGEMGTAANDRRERALCPARREGNSTIGRANACARALLRCQSRWRLLHRGRQKAGSAPRFRLRRCSQLCVRT